MKFEVIVGNPPYQLGNQSIHHLFIEKAISYKAKYICFITKNNWLTSNTLSDTRHKIIEYGLNTLINFPKLKDVFNDVNVSVCILLLHKDYKGDVRYREIEKNNTIEDTKLHYKNIVAQEKIITNQHQISIINKVKSNKDFQQFNLPKNARLFSISSNGKFMQSTYTEDIIKYLSDTEINTVNKHDLVEVVFLDSSHNRFSRFTTTDFIYRGKEYIDKYKVVCGSKVSTTDQVYSNINLLMPGQIMTNSFGIIGLMDTGFRAMALWKYAKTKFHRALVYFGLGETRITYGIGCTQYVPLQDFSVNSDIIWKNSIEDIDKQLFNKYNLSNDEIEYINKIIKY